MKTILLLACITATALCVPIQFLEVEHTYLSPQQQEAAGPSHHTSVEYLIPVGRQHHTGPLRLYPSQAYIKQEIPQAPGRASIEAIYPISGLRRPAPVVPVAPVYPVAPVRSAKADDEDQDD